MAELPVMGQFEIMGLVPLLGKGGARGGSVNLRTELLGELIEPPLTRPNPSFAKEGNQTHAFKLIHYELPPRSRLANHVRYNGGQR